MGDESMVLESLAPKVDELEAPKRSKDAVSGVKQKEAGTETKTIKQEADGDQTKLKQVRLRKVLIQFVAHTKIVKSPFQDQKTIGEEQAGAQAPCKTSLDGLEMDWQGLDAAVNKEVKDPSEGGSENGSAKSSERSSNDGADSKNLNESRETEEPDEPITSLRTLTVGKPFIE